jgi:hypothetical protein
MGRAVGTHSIEHLSALSDRLTKEIATALRPVLSRSLTPEGVDAAICALLAEAVDVAYDAARQGQLKPGLVVIERREKDRTAA